MFPGFPGIKIAFDKNFFSFWNFSPSGIFLLLEFFSFWSFLLLGVFFFSEFSSFGIFPFLL
jgi:hypothetical protein